jgi:hypothetical protein
MLKRPCDDTEPSCGHTTKKPRKEGQAANECVDESITSDETWSFPSSENESSEDEKEEPAPKLLATRVLRSSGAVVRPGDEMHAVMDKIDEVVDNESDFSSTTDEEEEEDEESDDDGEEDDEEDESDTEEDGYSDDDSFVTSCDEDEAEEETEVQLITEENTEERILDPITTDELLANFGDVTPLSEELTLLTSAEEQY